MVVSISSKVRFQPRRCPICITGHRRLQGGTRLRVLYHSLDSLPRVPHHRSVASRIPLAHQDQLQPGSHPPVARRHFQTPTQCRTILLDRSRRAILLILREVVATMLQTTRSVAPLPTPLALQITRALAASARQQLLHHFLLLRIKVVLQAHSAHLHRRHHLKTQVRSGRHLQLLSDSRLLLSQPRVQAPSVGLLQHRQEALLVRPRAPGASGVRLVPILEVLGLVATMLGDLGVRQVTTQGFLHSDRRTLQGDLIKDPVLSELRRRLLRNPVECLEVLPQRHWVDLEAASRATQIHHLSLMVVAQPTQATQVHLGDPTRRLDRQVILGLDRQIILGSDRQIRVMLRLEIPLEAVPDQIHHRSAALGANKMLHSASNRASEDKVTGIVHSALGSDLVGANNHANFLLKDDANMAQIASFLMKVNREEVVEEEPSVVAAVEGAVEERSEHSEEVEVEEGVSERSEEEVVEVALDVPSKVTLVPFEVR